MQNDEASLVVVAIVCDLIRYVWIKCQDANYGLDYLKFSIQKDLFEARKRTPRSMGDAEREILFANGIWNAFEFIRWSWQTFEALQCSPCKNGRFGTSNDKEATPLQLDFVDHLPDLRFELLYSWTINCCRIWFHHGSYHIRWSLEKYGRRILLTLKQPNGLLQHWFTCSILQLMLYLFLSILPR